MESRLSWFESCVRSFMMGDFDMQKRIFILKLLSVIGLLFFVNILLFLEQKMLTIGLEIIKYKCVRMMRKK